MKPQIVISGANRGIGLELVYEFVRNGYQVIAGVRDPKNIIQLKDHFRADTCQVFQLDVTSESSVQQFADQVSRVNILINNAGVLSQYATPLEETSLIEVEKMFQINTLGTLRLTKALLPKLRMQHESIIANISSLTGSLTDNTRSGKGYGYRMSKVAINMITRSLTVDYPNLVSVSLHPGWVQTEMGGPEAPVKPKESAQGLFQVITNLKSQDRGKFIDYQGKSLPW